MNRWREAVQVALLDIRLNPARSVLSLSGIVIGIAAVTAILAFGAGMREMVYERFMAMGLAEYRVYPGYDEKTLRIGELGPEQVERLKALPFAQTVFPETSMHEAEARSEWSRTKAAVMSMSHASSREASLRVREGRALLPADLDSRAQNCLLTEAAAAALFPDGKALGRLVWVDGISWTVVGVFAWGSSSFRYTPPQAVILPFLALSRLYDNVNIDDITVLVRPEFKGDAPKEILKALGHGDPARERLFRVSNQQEFLEKSAKTVREMTLILALIAVLSLFVGEIGVMNVMLTAVAERTREIGLRRALGARKRDILNQFLVESVVLNLLGGVLGLALGVVLAQFLPSLLASMMPNSELRVRILPGAVLFAVGSCSLLGALFGVYPASKAARLSPAEALRAE